MNYYKALVTTLILSTSLVGLSHAKAFTKPRTMVISVPVTHLMSKPQQRNENYEKCSYQATQVLFGEHVVGYEEQNGWVRIKTLEQEAFWNNKWITCSGWVPQEHLTSVTAHKRGNLVVSSHTADLAVIARNNKVEKRLKLCFGSYLHGKRLRNGMWKVSLPNKKVALISDSHVSRIAENELDRNTTLARNKLAMRGTHFLGDPYLWAGRSAYNPEMTSVSGTDCSGLTNILYRSIGMRIPRCSHDQYSQSKKLIKLGKQSVGDLVFVYYGDKDGKINDRIGHVMMYLGNGRLLEAEGTVGGHVRIVRDVQRFGKSIESIKSGEIVQDYKTFARSPLGNSKVLTESPHGRCKLVFGSYL